MGTREELDDIIRETIGSNNVYFQPPDNMKISYPCVVYELEGFWGKNADNRNYHRRRYYHMIYITRNPDDPVIEKLEDLPACAMGRPYDNDNLHHYPYTIYY